MKANMEKKQFTLIRCSQAFTKAKILIIGKTSQLNLRQVLLFKLWKGNNERNVCQ